jgi:hypothetical protein
MGGRHTWPTLLGTRAGRAPPPPPPPPPPPLPDHAGSIPVLHTVEEHLKKVNSGWVNKSLFLDDDDEEGSEIEGHDRPDFGEHGGHGNAGAGGVENDYLFLHLDEPRQGKVPYL